MLLLLLYFAFRFSVIFSRLGLREGGCLHLVVGNHNLTFPACAGAWILGAKVSCGDVALEAKAIAGQVRLHVKIKSKSHKNSYLHHKKSWFGLIKAFLCLIKDIKLENRAIILYEGRLTQKLSWNKLIRN